MNFYEMMKVVNTNKIVNVKVNMGGLIPTYAMTPKRTQKAHANTFNSFVLLNPLFNSHHPFERVRSYIKAREERK